MRATCLALLLLASASARPADGLDLARLMRLLAESPSTQVPYVEKKYSALLAEPVVSSGTLVYQRPDVVEKIMTAPRAERFRIAGQELTLTRNGQAKRIALASEPLLSAFAASLRGVLSGDAAQLQEHFSLALEGTQDAWRLTLTPREADIERYVERILVSGRDGRALQIEVREASGDRSVLQVR